MAGNRSLRHPMGGGRTELCDSGVILKTNDGGTNWFTQYVDPTCSVNGVSFSDGQHGYAVGSRHDVDPGPFLGILLRTTDGGGTWLRTETDQEEFFSVYSPGSNRAWAVGWCWVPMTGLVRMTTDGGLSWETA